MSSPFRSPFHAPALIACHGLSSVLTPDGELLSLSASDLKPLLRNFSAPLLVHGPATLRILELPPEPAPAPWFDLLELFLFVYPARPVTPTARGLALALGLVSSEHHKPLHAGFLYQMAQKLLLELNQHAHTETGDTLRALLIPLRKGGWSWSDAVTEALASPPDPATDSRRGHRALQVWKRLPEWEDHAPRTHPGTHPVTPAAARQRLHDMLGPDAEPRPGQADFSSAACYAFSLRDIPKTPNIVLAEAGTGTGKTMGYIAPASLWAEANDSVVWISTYTRHLQRQIEQELTRLYPDPALRRERAVIRKGRENYLCLLNLEERVNTAQNQPVSENHRLIPLALLVRWTENTADGDIMGGDLPGWFGELFGHGFLTSLADRRGECIYGACSHYQSCFIEHTVRRARLADIVIANHALVLSQASWNALLPQDHAPADLPDEHGIPTRYIFDEGHHIPDAADSAFSLVFSGLETAELRRWLLGAEGGRSRAKGLRRRMEDILELIPELYSPLEDLLHATQNALPLPGWSIRLHKKRQNNPTFPNEEETGHTEILPENPSEAFLHALEQQLIIRSNVARSTHKPFRDCDECDLHPVSETLMEQTEYLCEALDKMIRPLKHLNQLMGEHLTKNEALDAAALQRLEVTIRSLYRRAIIPLEGWRQMLSSLIVPTEERQSSLFIDFIKREILPSSHPDTENCDIGLNRHWLDPAIPFAHALRNTTHGLLITSATLRDQSAFDDEEESWEKAEARLGTSHFLAPPHRAALLSPFNYTKQARAYVITDITSDIEPLARAFQQLFECSGGGALGLFTAIKRLKKVHQRIHEALGNKGISLYAQHSDAMDNATLIDIFRTETESCLLGTDAMRDGIDVPGNALRMVVFERTPWPRPDILHRERRRLLSRGRPKSYDDQIARMRLRQAFGRLIRRRDDYGVFVMLDRQTPSRLFSAFPEGTPIKRLSLTEALEDIHAFFKNRKHN